MCYGVELYGWELSLCVWAGGGGVRQGGEAEVAKPPLYMNQWFGGGQ